jgi:CheY-like chemotaxis protein
MEPKRILSVGQCGADHYSISTFLQSHFDGVEVEPMHTTKQAIAALKARPFNLVLVNRRFDWDGGPGLDLIRAMKADGELASVPVMLVSNHADAQKEAMAAGAIRGFGKANLNAALAVVGEVFGDT